MTQGRFEVNTLEFAGLDMLTLGALGAASALLIVLIISFRSRGRVFCQYLKHMSGIELNPKLVNRVFKTNGRAGVRDLLIDLIIQEDLADPSRIVTPGGKPEPSIYDSGVFDS